MKTECCHGDCSQGRTCNLRAPRGPIISYVICSIAAVAMVACIGAAQVLDDHDAQVVAGQVMACSQHPEVCREHFASHAATSQNPRQ